MINDLNDSNIMLYASKCYDKPICIDSEFEEDFRKIRYIKRLLQRYRNTGKMRERLLLNHLVIAQNVFGVEPCTRMLFVKVEPEDYSTLKTFLIYTSAMPTVVRSINGADILSSDIPLNTNIVDILRKL